MSFGESWKALGNQAFQAGDYSTAIVHFTKAIEADASSAVYFVNRSLCHAALSDWAASLSDAEQGLSLDGKHLKAHFRRIKALIALERFVDARRCLLQAVQACGENKDLRALEEDIFSLTGTPLRPKSTDFEIICELGDGNFSKVYKTYLKRNKRIFAVKTIEKQTIEKMKRRHPNINNEILMEKRALHRLSHPGIVTLYSTFQDFGTLYFQMEYVGGGDLWTSLHEIVPHTPLLQTEEEEEERVSILDDHGEEQNAPKFRGRTGAQLGVHWSQLRFFFAEMVSVLEHMHRRGIAHRDIKPENIMISDRGHLKFVDFGTAKDMIQRDLNGQEFVGTPEYMSPGTVCVKNGGPQKKERDAAATFSSNEGAQEGESGVDQSVDRLDGGVGLEADLWAVGVTFFQMVLGFTPFNAASPYLVFLRIKRDLLRIPSWVPEPIAAMIHVLLEKDPKKRMELCCGRSVDSHSSDPSQYTSLSYDKLREHAFFSEWDAALNFPQRTFYRSKLRELQSIASSSEEDEREFLPLRADDRFESVSAIRAVYSQSEVPRVPSLHDLCLRALADAAVNVAFASAHNGGLRPKIPWMQRFQLHKLLSPCDRSRVMHLLERKEKLHVPSVHRLFFSSLPDSRCRRACVDSREVVGMSRALQGHYTADFLFAAISSPSLGESESEEESRLRASVSSLNKVRPKFLALFGSFTTADSLRERERFLAAIDRFRKVVARVSDTIPVQLVPGPREVGLPATPESLSLYRSLFGADFYGFWFQGMRGIVINSSLLIDGSAAPEDAQLQETWLEEEIEQCKLCASTIVLFSYHSWYKHEIEEDDSDDDDPCARTIPRAVRKRWLNKLQHHKIKLVFSGAKSTEKSFPLRPFKSKQRSNEGEDNEVCNEQEEDKGKEDHRNVEDKKEDIDSDSDGFENIEDYYEGPEMLTAESSEQAGFRLVFVREEEMQHKDLRGDAIPGSMQEALDIFKRQAK